jgi:ABC-type lipoprotein export system ATPase subunit
MGQPLFDIQNLSCSYSQTERDKVLFIESLQIPKGKIIFLLGASGSGKSTFLETLGLMNRTIAAGEVMFFAGDDPAPVHFSRLWQKDAQEVIAGIRKRYFSFIFQQTNLMENFTAYENICISRMIQNNIPQQKVMKGAEQLMKNVKLPETEVNIKTLAVNLSGGQKQRLAFVRALLANFTVLFGDEPTGNLDEENARDLIEIIKKQLKASQTAIIVSHNIDLALHNADQIIVITKEPGERFGRIKREHIFYREAWEKYTSQQLQEFRAKLSAHYTLPATSGTPKGTIENKGKLSSNYRSLFLRKESRALMGSRGINLAILVVMLFFTLLVVGFANGSLGYLEQKMQDPFVNWLTIDIPWGKSSEINDLKRLLNTDEQKEKFGYAG